MIEGSVLRRFAPSAETTFRFGVRGASNSLLITFANAKSSILTAGRPAGDVRRWHFHGGSSTTMILYDGHSTNDASL